MAKAFTHYWGREACQALEVDRKRRGRTELDHTAGNLFERRGVHVGDTVYAVTIRRGKMYLIGRMHVERVLHSTKQASQMLGYEVWDASDHLLAAPHDRTEQRLDRQVPESMVRKLHFESNAGPQGLKFAGPGELDRQTLRGVRELTSTSAMLLDELL